MPISDRDLELAKAIVALQTNITTITETLKRLEDVNEGTVERKGMKERIALAEHEIDEHKKAWIKNEQVIRDMGEGLNRALAAAIANLSTDVTRKFDSLMANIQKQETWITKVKPYMDVLVWIVSLLAGWFIIQVASGNIVIGKTP